MREDSRDVTGRAEPRAREPQSTLPEGIGLSERFMAMGQAAGFDMTRPEGVAAWSSEYKRRVMTGQPLEITLPPAF